MSVTPLSARSCALLNGPWSGRHLTFAPCTLYGEASLPAQNSLEQLCASTTLYLQAPHSEVLNNPALQRSHHPAGCQHCSHQQPRVSRTACSRRTFSWMSFKVTGPCFPQHVGSALWASFLIARKKGSHTPTKGFVRKSRFLIRL